MCIYADSELGNCKIQGDRCPYTYYCSKTGNFRATKYMPDDCKVKLNAEVPKGYYRVTMAHKGYLYVDLGSMTIKVKSPWEEAPEFVKAYQTKSGEWRVRK